MPKFVHAVLAELRAGEARAVPALDRGGADGVAAAAAGVNLARERAPRPDPFLERAIAVALETGAKLVEVTAGQSGVVARVDVGVAGGAVVVEPGHADVLARLDRRGGAVGGRLRSCGGRGRGGRCHRRTGAVRRPGPTDWAANEQTNTPSPARFCEDRAGHHGARKGGRHVVSSGGRRNGAGGGDGGWSPGDGEPPRGLTRCSGWPGNRRTCPSGIGRLASACRRPTPA